MRPQEGRCSIAGRVGRGIRPLLLWNLFSAGVLVLASGFVGLKLMGSGAATDRLRKSFEGGPQVRREVVLEILDMHAQGEHAMRAGTHVILGFSATTLALTTYCIITLCRGSGARRVAEGESPTS